MKTFFASPERTDELKLRKSISQTGTNEVISGLLQASAGILAVLNEQRQVLAVNDAFLREFGIHDAGHILGLRPGEAVGCVHAWDMEAGCGTSQWCATCGAAIAIVAALAQKKPQQRKCVLELRSKKTAATLCLAVYSSLISVGKANYVVLFLQDISDPERRAALERIFLHDLKNLAMGIRFTADLMNDKNNASLPEIAAMMKTISARLTSELSVQTTLSHAGGRAYKPERTKVLLADILRDVQHAFLNHGISRRKLFTVANDLAAVTLVTDATLVVRVLTNMVTNAFEATAEDGQIKLWVQREPHFITFCVWNKGRIPLETSLRVFQQYFSTKEGPGRGFGTYSMKLLGEQFLGGKVSFTSSDKEGTVFRFSVPVG
jgi:signal transduction histidine kinase